MKTIKHIKFLRLFGDNLRNLRRKQNLSQEDLAYEADVSISQISRMERGIINTSIRQLCMIANAMGLKPRALLDFDYA